MSATHATTFLDLPGELRNRICNLLLLKPNAIKPQDPFHRAEERALLPIFLSNKQISSQAKNIYFGANTVAFSATDSTHACVIETFNNYLRKLFARLDPSPNSRIAHLRSQAFVPHFTLSVDGYPRLSHCLGFVDLNLRVGPESVHAGPESVQDLDLAGDFPWSCEGLRQDVWKAWNLILEKQLNASVQEPDDWMTTPMSRAMGIVHLAKGFADRIRPIARKARET